ncbi:hypothetical protein [Glutamicibacter sp.]|uniref:hypothetical protein n=1 Tax=Glutamicibacter sp. TaxID=1931995 RepID=UPI0028BE936E|nr:hypothetical protein [Glutamicibacter sp.]
MSRRQKINILLAGPLSAFLVLGLLYFALASQLPKGVVRQVGAHGVGYAPPGIVVGVMAAVALTCFGVGAWTCLDFTALGHWFAGTKSIVVCLLGAGYAVIALAVTTLFASLGPATTLDAHSLGYGLLALVVAFAAAASVLVGVLPRAKDEPLGT